MLRGVTAIALAVLLVLAGCSGPGDRTPEPIEGTASAATIDDDDLSAAGYERALVESRGVNRTGTIDVSGDVEMTVEYRVRATARRAVYRSTDGDLPSIVALYSVPLVSPDSVDATIDPLGDRSTAAVVGRVQGTYADVQSLEWVENRSVKLLGNETTLVEYATTAAVDGQSVDVVVSVARVRHAGDVVRVVVILPRDSADPTAVRRLLGAVQH